jgi:magnesium transporter
MEVTMDVPVPEPVPAPGDPGSSGPLAHSVSLVEPPRCPTRTRWYRDGRLAEEGFPAEDISERLDADAGSFAWLDLDDPDEQDLAIVTQEFGLHPLAVEDAVHDHQRPKLDRYATHLFSNVYAIETAGDGLALRTSEISAFITPRALVTVRKAPFDVDALVARWDAVPELTRSGVGFLLHGLLDAVVDGQEQVVDALADRVQALEDALFDGTSRGEIRRTGFLLRKDLIVLRRVILPMGEVLARLLRGEEGRPTPVHGELLPYFEDVRDHVLRIGDDVEAARELVGSVLETNVNEQSNELNEITKKLASWAAIIAVPTAVTGFYGQNVPYPGFGKEWGFLTSTLLLVVLAGGLYLLLRRRGWL